MTRSCHRHHCKGRTARHRPESAGAGPDAARRMIAAAWPWLDLAQQSLLRSRYWRGLSVEEAAAVLATSAAEAGRAEAKALLLCRRVIAGLYDPQTGDPLPAPIPA